MEEKWNIGFPKKLGWYRCRVDGVEERLLLFICPLSGRKSWKRLSGGFAIGYIEWTGEPGRPIDD